MWYKAPCGFTETALKSWLSDLKQMHMEGLHIASQCTSKVEKNFDLCGENEVFSRRKLPQFQENGFAR